MNRIRQFLLVNLTQASFWKTLHHFYGVNESRIGLFTLQTHPITATENQQFALEKWWFENYFLFWHGNFSGYVKLWGCTPQEAHSPSVWFVFPAHFSWVLNAFQDLFAGAWHFAFCCIIGESQTCHGATRGSRLAHRWAGTTEATTRAICTGKHHRFVWMPQIGFVAFCDEWLRWFFKYGIWWSLMSQSSYGRHPSKKKLPPTPPHPKKNTKRGIPSADVNTQFHPSISPSNEI